MREHCDPHMRPALPTAYATALRGADARNGTDVLTKEPLTLNLLSYVSNAHEAGTKNG